MRSALFGVVLGASVFVHALASGSVPAEPSSAQSSLTQFSFVGLPAECLLASGLSPQQIVAAAGRLAEAAGTLDSLDSAGRQLAGARSRVIELEGEIARGSATDGLTQTLAEARAALASLEQQVSALRASLRSLVLTDASAEQRALLERAMDGAKIGIDVALAVAAGNNAELRQLAVSLQAEARSLQLGEELDPAYQEVLAAARAHPTVVAAASRMATQWPALRQTLLAASPGGQR